MACAMALGKAGCSQSSIRHCCDEECMAFGISRDHGRQTLRDPATSQWNNLEGMCKIAHITYHRSDSICNHSYQTKQSLSRFVEPCFSASALHASALPIRISVTGTINPRAMVSRLAVTGSAFCLHLYANGKLLAGAFSSFRKISSCRFRAVVSVPSRSSDFSTMPPSWRALSRALQFDKVPEKEPDWGDDGDDHNQMNGRGRGGNDGTGAGGNGGMGNGGGNFGGDNGNILQKLAALWTAAVTRRPLLTKALSTMIISMAGDYSSQRLVAWRRGDGRFTLDRRRLLSMGIWGFFFIGPALHFWYGALDRSFTGRNAVLLKLLCDQLLFAPVSNASFILGTGTLEGRGLSKSAETLRSTLWPSMKANWTVRYTELLISYISLLSC